MGSAPEPAAPSAPIIPETLSLARAIEIGIEYSPVIRSAEQGVRVTEGQYAQAVSGIMPRLDVSAQRVTPLDIPEFSFQSTDSAWSTDFTFTQPVYAGGRLRANIRAARSLRRGTEEQYIRTAHEVAFAIRGSYYGVLTAEQQVLVAQETVDSAVEQARVAKLRYEAGVAPEFDVLSAQARVARVDQTLIAAKSDLHIARATLGTVMGVPIPEDTKLTTPSFGTPADTGDLESLIEEALDRRPDLLALRDLAAAARQQLAAARAGRYPTLGLGLSYTLREKTTIDGEVFGAPGVDIVVSQNSGTVLIGANWSLYNGGQVEGEVVEAKARLRQSEKEIQRLEQQVELAVTSAYVLVRAAGAQIDAAQRELAQAEETNRVANIRYQEGVSTSVEILSSEAELEGARTRLNTAVFDRDLALAQLDLALGRDWRASIPLEQEPEASGDG
jgi:outer membrane protein TolC